MNKKTVISTYLILIFMVLSCKKINQTYQGTNEIVTDAPSVGYQIQEGNTKSVTIKFTLTTPLSEDLKLELAWNAATTNQADPNLVFTISEKIIVIKKGTLNSSVLVKSSGAKNLIWKNTKYILKPSISGTSTAIIKFNGIKITAIPATEFPVLTAEQQRRLKETPINIGLWTGIVPVEVSVVSYAGGNYSFEKAGKFTYLGNTVIVPDESAANISTLKMLKNAFGLNEYYYKVFRGETVEISALTEGGFNYEIIKLSKWTKTSVETFNMLLKNLVFRPESTGSKLGTVQKAKSETSRGKTVFKVPFSYDFSAAKRLDSLADSGNAEAKVYKGSLNPEDILYAWPAIEETISASGTYNEETGELKFVIYLSHSNSSNTPNLITITYRSPQKK